MKPRPIRIEGELAYVPLTRGMTAVIDASDAPLIEGKNWYALHTPSGKIYAARTVLVGGKYRAELMHRVIARAVDGEEVDHRDADGLNNRRGNLRCCTHQQNMANQVVTRRSSTGIKGVVPEDDAYVAKLQVGDRRFRIGRFSSPEEAGEAYASAARRVHGDFAR